MGVKYASISNIGKKRQKFPTQQRIHPAPDRKQIIFIKKLLFQIFWISFSQSFLNRNSFQIKNSFYVKYNINIIFMGGGGHRHHVVYNPPVYVHVGPTDAQIQAKEKLQEEENARLQENRKRVQKQLQEARQRQMRQNKERQRIQRQNFARAQQIRFQEYLKNLSSMNLTTFIPAIGKGEKHYAVVGPISAGKTTLLNSIFNISQEVGLGQTTQIAKPVYKNSQKKLIVWDVPGINKDFSIYDPKKLGFFKSLSKIFILYKDSPKVCDKVIKVLNQIKPGCLYLIRTQCDTWDHSSLKTLQQQRTEDKQILSSWNIKINNFYQYSSYFFEYDNVAVKNQISI